MTDFNLVVRDHHTGEPARVPTDDDHTSYRAWYAAQQTHLKDCADLRASTLRRSEHRAARRAARRAAANVATVPSN